MKTVLKKRRTVLDSDDEPEPAKETLLVFDMMMEGHAKPEDTSDAGTDAANDQAALSSHPETPDRVLIPWRALKNRGLVARCSVPKQGTLAPATRDQILLVHSETLVNKLEESERLSPDALKAFSRGSEKDDLFYTPDTATCAKLACGAAIRATEDVLLGKCKNAFALIRPPGHHAEPSKSMGYCHINNVAVAVELMLRRKQAKRVLIVDWDVHHGNGTQKHFWNNPDCLYFSVHRFDGGAFYPFSKDGDLDQIGGPNAMGRTVNVPWPFGGFDDGDYVYVWEMLLIPIAKEFSPDIVVVSCGFDCQEDDKTGGCFVSPTGFAYLTKLLMDPAIAGGKLVLVMEGGVNPDKMADSVSTCVSTLLGDSLKKNSQAKLVSKEVKTVVSHVMSVQRRFWKCIEETAARERLPTKITELEESTKYLSATYSMSSAFLWYRRCKWIVEHKLEPLQLDSSHLPFDLGMGFEFLGSPFRKLESSATAYLLILDDTFVAVPGSDNVRDGSLKWVTKFMADRTPFLVLEFNNEFPRNDNVDRLDSLVRVWWNELILRNFNTKKLAIIAAGDLATKAANFLVEFVQRPSPTQSSGSKKLSITALVLFAHNHIPALPPQRKSSMGKPIITLPFRGQQCLFVSGDVNGQLAKEQTRLSHQSQKTIVTSASNSLAELMIHKFEDAISFLAAQ